MPIPSKESGEKKSKFMARCVADPVMRKEFSDIKQRIAVCLSKYSNKKKEKMWPLKPRAICQLFFSLFLGGQRPNCPF